MSLPDRLERHVERIPWSGCWIWTGATTKGYGQATYLREHYYAHRLSWELHNGRIPAGQFVCHSCDTPLCIRPDHLFLGTAKENNRDAINKGRFRGGVAIGEANGFAKLTAKQVAEIRRRYANGEPAYRIAPDYGIGRSQAWNVATNKAWRHVDGV